jgi:hypothetical protein
LIVFEMEYHAMSYSLGRQSVDVFAWVLFAGDTQLLGSRPIQKFVSFTRRRQFNDPYQIIAMPGAAEASERPSKRQKVDELLTPVREGDAVTPFTFLSDSVRRVLNYAGGNAITLAPAPATPDAVGRAVLTGATGCDVALRADGHGVAMLLSPVRFGATTPVARQERQRYCCPFIVPPYWLEHEVADARGVRRPPTRVVFPQTACPYTGIPRDQLIEYAYTCFMEFMNIRYSEKITSANRSVLSYDHHNYTTSCLTSIAVLLVHGVANGFESTPERPGNALVTYKELFPDRTEHYQVMMYDVLVYLFKYGVPEYLWSTLWRDAESKTVVTARQTFLGHRTRHKLWSSEYADTVLQALGTTNKYLCKGHNYQIALIFDRIIPRKTESAIVKHRADGHHYLTAEQLSIWFDSNQGCCFWDNSSSTQVTRYLPNSEV